MFYWESWRYSYIDNDRIQWIIRQSPHEFHNWVHTISCLFGYVLVYIFLNKLYGFNTKWCQNVCLYVCTNNIRNIDIVTLGTCMGPYFVILCVYRYLGGSDFLWAAKQAKTSKSDRRSRNDTVGLEIETSGLEFETYGLEIYTKVSNSDRRSRTQTVGLEIRPQDSKSIPWDSKSLWMR